MSDVSYPVPWKLIAGLGPNVLHRTPTSVDAFSAGVCARIRPEPVIRGLENLPASPRFVLVANHYQRKGLWILHPAAVLTQAIRKQYGPGDPPVRWIVTANWPHLKIGPFRIASPGDILLPRVADALACYPFSFAGSNQMLTAKSIRRILREIPKAERPIGLFPEGVAGSAGALREPLPGVERLLRHLAKAGLDVQPVGISENGGLEFRFGPGISAAEVLESPQAGKRVMEAVRQLL